MKRTVIAAAILALGAAGTGVSLADPGPNGNNDYGLCNAYSHNNDHAHKAPPFAALEKAAADANQSVAQWCAENGQKPGNGGGNGG